MIGFLILRLDVRWISAALLAAQAIQLPAEVTLLPAPVIPI